MKTILIIEDDRELNRGLCVALEKVGYATASAFDLETARHCMQRTPALVLLDVNLPDGSGLDFLAELKAQNSKLSVIMLTSNDTDIDIVKGLEQGADDYITKPFSLAVLRARVAVQLRNAAKTKDVTGETSSYVDIDVKHSGYSSRGRTYQSESYFFDFDKMIFRSLTFRKFQQGKSVDLSKTEQRLLHILVANAGVTVKRSQLIDRIWTDGEEFVDENALSVAVKRLRDKLNAKENIRTVYGLGYRWEDKSNETK